MGRPRKRILKSEIVKVRYTSAEKILLQSFSTRSGNSISEYVRNKSLDHKMISRLTEEEVHLLRGLIGMATNLNQIAKRVNMGDATNAMIAEILLVINSQINKIK